MVVWLTSLLRGFKPRKCRPHSGTNTSASAAQIVWPLLQIIPCRNWLPLEETASQGDTFQLLIKGLVPPKVSSGEYVSEQSHNVCREQLVYVHEDFLHGNHSDRENSSKRSRISPTTKLHAPQFLYEVGGTLYIRLRPIYGWSSPAKCFAKVCIGKPMVLTALVQRHTFLWIFGSPYSLGESPSKQCKVFFMPGSREDRFSSSPVLRTTAAVVSTNLS